jgi:hypothetical protein
MRNTARALPPLAVFFLFTACGSVAPGPRASPSPTPATGLVASPRRIIGRVLAIDRAHGFVVVDLAPGAPVTALVPDTELLLRTDDLRTTARVRVSRQQRGRTLGTILLSGAPGIGDEVVLPAPP